MISLAEKTASDLRADIQQGNYQIGQKLSDEYSLAEKYGVSRGTLRQALKILDNERLIIRHQGRGTFVSNPTYSEVDKSLTALLGIMVYDKGFFGTIIQGAASRASSKGYMLITGTNINSDEECQHTEAFVTNQISGVIMSPRPDNSPENYDRLIASNIPVVFLDTILPGRQEDFVGVDDYRGTHIATQHLIDLGHRKLAYLGHNNLKDIPCRSNRLRGFQDACQEAEIVVPDKWQLSENGFKYDPLTLLKTLGCDDRPTGFVTFSDIWAVRAINAAKKLNLSVPGDLSVVGFDDSTIAQNYDIPLTSVHPEFEEIGRAAIDLLLDKTENILLRPKRNVTVTPKLVIRKSTAPPA
jgi:GntR family transcriptional regulator of arabinose operon